MLSEKNNLQFSEWNVVLGCVGERMGQTKYYKEMMGRGKDLQNTSCK